MSAPSPELVRAETMDNDLIHVVCAHWNEVEWGETCVAFCGADLTDQPRTDATEPLCPTCVRLSGHLSGDDTMHCTGKRPGDPACTSCPQHLLRLLEVLP